MVWSWGKDRQIIPLAQMIKLIDSWDELDIEFGSGTSLNHGCTRADFDINPEEFVDFANVALETPGKQSIVNSLSNSKRAIDCQLNKVLFCFGLNKIKLDFPSKINTLQELGIIAPRILSKINKQRNLLEHEYKCPSREQAEEAVDIAMLFIGASNRILETFVDNFIIGNKSMFDEHYRLNNCISFYFDIWDKNRKFTLVGYKDGLHIGETDILPHEKAYINILKLEVAFQQDKRIWESFKEFAEMKLEQ